jgi:hypothetical protein
MGEKLLGNGLVVHSRIETLEIRRRFGVALTGAVGRREPSAHIAHGCSIPVRGGVGSRHDQGRVHRRICAPSALDFELQREVPL